MSRLTHALLRPETALAAAEALRGRGGKAEVEGLIELLGKPHAARLAVVAIAALHGRLELIIEDGLTAALDSPHSSVRLAAVQALHERGATAADGGLLRRLRQDESWPVRRAALYVLAARPDPGRWRILDAVTDPHWRVRHALIQSLLAWGDTEARRREIDERLGAVERSARVEGVRLYLHYRWSGTPPEAFPQAPEPPAYTSPVWDWDAAVLARKLAELSDAGRREALHLMPGLLSHPDERVHGQAVEALRACGTPAQLAQAVALLDEPRAGAGEAVQRLLAALDLDRTEAVARVILHLPNPGPAQLAWALDQVGEAPPPEDEEETLLGLLRRAPDQPAEVRAALARLAGRWDRPDAEDWWRCCLEDTAPEVQLAAVRGLSRRTPSCIDEATLRRLLASALPGLRAEAVRAAVGLGCPPGLLEPLAVDRDVGVRTCLAECLARREEANTAALLARLQGDAHPHVRAAALTPALAAELVKEPARETSWHVLAQAARMARVPFWKLEPKPAWQPEAVPRPAPEPLSPRRLEPADPRTLGPAKLAVAPLGVSGHYGLPVAGFVRAMEAGVNLFFWEPNYQTLTEFTGRLPVADRNALHFVTGTFEADGNRVRKDAERALRLLKIDRLALFLMFWVQSWERIAPDVRAALERLKQEGKVALFGLSTHSRPLAVEAMEAGWDPIMVRHSAAHRGVEQRIFPRAVELGASLLTFNITCYGRLLQTHSGLSAPSAADCYRYALGQPGVRACWSAPATLEELEENLAALRDPRLPEDRREQLLTHGERVYQEDVIFRKLVRAL